MENSLPMAAFTSIGSDSCENSLSPAALTALTLKMYFSPVLSPWQTNLNQNRQGILRKYYRENKSFKGEKKAFLPLYLFWFLKIMDKP